MACNGGDNPEIIMYVSDPEAGVAGGFNLIIVLLGQGAGGSAAGLSAGGLVINATNAASLSLRLTTPVTRLRYQTNPQ